VAVQHGTGVSNADLLDRIRDLERTLELLTGYPRLTELARFAPRRRQSHHPGRESP
jgi:uncharacterized protein (DUF433 family)